MTLESADSVNNSYVPTHRYVVEGDVSHVVIGAALPRVVESEAKSAAVSSLQRRVLAECTVLHIDGSIVNLHAADWKISAKTQTFMMPSQLRSASLFYSKCHLCVLFF